MIRFAVARSALLSHVCLSPLTEMSTTVVALSVRVAVGALEAFPTFEGIAAEPANSIAQIHVYDPKPKILIFEVLQLEANPRCHTGATSASPCLPAIFPASEDHVCHIEATLESPDS